MIYRAITRGLDHDDKLRVDAILGDERAKAALDESRRESVSAAGFEVG